MSYFITMVGVLFGQNCNFYVDFVLGMVCLSYRNRVPHLR